MDIPLLVPNEMIEINLYNLIEMFNNEISVNLEDNYKKCKKKRKILKRE